MLWDVVLGASFQVRDGIGAAWVPGVAAEDAPEGKAGTTKEPVAKEGFTGVGGTGGVKAATAGGAKESVFHGRNK
jgi:hypothetical protein